MSHFSRVPTVPEASSSQPHRRKKKVPAWEADRNRGDEDIEGFKKMRTGGFWVPDDPDHLTKGMTREEVLAQYRESVKKMERKRYFNNLHIEMSRKYTKYATKWGVFVISLAIYFCIDDMIELQKWRSLHIELPRMLKVQNCFDWELDVTSLFEFLILVEFLFLLGIIWGFYRNPFQVFYYGWLMVRFVRYVFNFAEIARPIVWGKRYRDIKIVTWGKEFFLPTALIFIEMWILIPGFLVYMYSRLGVPLYRKQRIAVRHTIEQYRWHLFYHARSLFIRKKERLRKWVAGSQAELLKNLARICDEKTPRKNYFRLQPEEIEKQLEETFAKLWDKTMFFLKETQPEPWKMKYREIKKWEKRLKTYPEYEKEIAKRRREWNQKLSEQGVNPNQYKDPYRLDLYEVAFHTEFDEFLFRKLRGKFNEIEKDILEKAVQKEEEDEDSFIGGYGSDFESLLN